MRKNQKLKLVTDPEGSSVYHEGNLLGHTPDFIDVSRQYHSQLLIKNNEKNKILPLKGHYRWGDSFYANFVWFFWFAPIGWVADFITGAAWNYDPVSPLTFNDKPFRPRQALLKEKEFSQSPLHQATMFYFQRT